MKNAAGHADNALRSLDIGHWASAVEAHLNELNYKRIIGFEVKCIFSDCNCNENEISLDDFHNCFDFGNVFALSWARKADYDKKDEKKRAENARGRRGEHKRHCSHKAAAHTHTRLCMRACERERERALTADYLLPVACPKQREGSCAKDIEADARF